MYHLSGLRQLGRSRPLKTKLGGSISLPFQAQWEQDYQAWCGQDLSKKQYVYIWVDGIHVNVRLDEEKICILVVMGADITGKKELLAVQ
jgi:hypothetical protein